MSTLAETIRFFNGTVLPHVLPKWQPRFRFGFAAFSLRPIESLNANGRMLVQNRRTAETKVSRCLRTAYFSRLFPSLLRPLGLVQAGNCIAVDFSDFRGRQVLTFAKQTGEGRAIPLSFATIRYPIAEGSQNTFIIAEVERFLATIGVPVHLIFDRGFELPALIQCLAQQSDVQFTIRLKSMKHVTTSSGRRTAIRTLRGRDVVITAYGHALRVVRSPRASGAAEPWYLLTNDRTTPAGDLIVMYARRFEIEEFFKDAKRLADLEYLRRNVSDRTLTTVLWFVILGCWMAWLTHGICAAWMALRSALHPHRRLSLLRWFWEAIQIEQCGVIRCAFSGKASVSM